MQFIIKIAELLQISDQEITELLSRIFVDDNFTSPDTATTLFDASAVRQRGNIIAAREKSSQILSGIVIVVYPTSPACRLAQANEVEMHLLGVKKEYRQFGLGKKLVKAAVAHAEQNACSKMLLWTQSSMLAAQCLYQSAGFVRNNKRDFILSQREFRVYEKILTASQEKR